MRVRALGAMSLLLAQSVAYGQTDRAEQAAPPEPPAEAAPGEQPPGSPPDVPPEQQPVAVPAPGEPPAAPSAPASAEPPATPPAAPAPVENTPEPEGEPADTQLGAVVVEASAVTATEAAKHSANAYPGAAIVNDTSKDLQRQATTLTAADLLSFTPGVYAQASGGNQGIRLSIRGSSINNTVTYKTGVGFYFDGLLMPGLAAGGAPPHLFEPLTVNYTEVFPGANAADLQPLQLGGAVNFVDHTGYTASPFHARVDAGSFMYFKAQVSTGRVVGPMDYYISASHQSLGGYQFHTKERGTRIIANMGYKISPNVTTRFYFRWAKEYFENGGLLTPDQIEENPRQAQQSQVDQNLYYEAPGAFWWGNKTSFRIDDESEIVFGISYDRLTQYNNSRGVANAFYAIYPEQSIAPSLVFKRAGHLFGKQSNSQVLLRNVTLLTAHSLQLDYTDPASPTYGQVIRDLTGAGTSHSVLAVSNDLEIVRNLWLKTGLAGAHIRSVSKYNVSGIVPPGTVDNSNEEQSGFDWTGVLGLRYALSPDVQLFSNLSRTIQPPQGRTNASQTGSVNLKNQRSTTVEVGTRAKVGIFDGSLSYYYSAVKNELLTVAVQLAPQIITATTNADPTTHQGVELGLNTLLWQSKDGTEEQPRDLSFRQSYTYNKFYFNDDPLWGENQLPGVPQHFYQAELLFRTGGLSVGVNTQAVAKVAADFANSLWVPAYVTFGAKAGFSPTKNWDFHLDVRNITDEHYVAYVRQVADARGAQQAVAAPGDGFGVFGGLSLRY